MGSVSCILAVPVKDGSGTTVHLPLISQMHSAPHRSVSSTFKWRIRELQCIGDSIDKKSIAYLN
jgi:hypothetical protein